ncbi:hypothetical protein D3C86_1150810 [compost metagenome]
MLVERTRHAVQNRQQRGLELRLVRVERHAAGNIDLQAAIRHLHYVDAQRRGAGLLHIVLDHLPVVADQAARHRTDTRADRRALAMPDQGANAGAQRRACTRSDSGVRLLLRGAPGQQRTRRRNHGDPVEYSC